MPEKLKLKAGAEVPEEADLYEGFKIFENRITANVGIDKIGDVMAHFLAMHGEPVFLFLEIPTNKENETFSAPGKTEAFHKDIYYLDGCSIEKAVSLLDRYGSLLFNDGLLSFGFGGHFSGDEIMFGKYNVLEILSEEIDKYSGFFETHGIEENGNLRTAWDFFSETGPGISKHCEEHGISIYDLPELLKEEGLYFAERREDNW